MPRDTMIGPLGMGQVLGFLARHVAARAVRRADEVLSRIFRIGVAPQAFSPEIAGPLGRRRAKVRIVAGGAAHAITARPFAHTQIQRLLLTHAAVGGTCSGSNEVRTEVGYSCS